MLRPYKLLSTSALVLTLTLSLGMSSTPAFAGIAVVVNPGNAINALSASEVKAIFLKKRKSFPGGDSAMPINQGEESDIYDDFASEVLQKDANQLKSYWSVQIFSGKATLPPVVHGDAAVKQQVSASAAAIGYIDSSHVDRSVKVVFTIE